MEPQLRRGNNVLLIEPHLGVRKGIFRLTTIRRENGRIIRIEAKPRNGRGGKVEISGSNRHFVIPLYLFGRNDSRQMLRDNARPSRNKTPKK